MGLLPFLPAIVTTFNSFLQKKHDMKMYQMQKADALENWNRQNEYNTPLAQMARLQAAGLNPHLALPNNAAAAQPVTVTPSVSPFSVGVPDSSSISSFYLFKLQQEELKEKIEAQKLSNQENRMTLLQRVKNLALQGDILTQEQRSKLLDNIGKEIENTFQQSTLNYRIEAQNLDNQIAKENLTSLIQNNDILRKTSKATIDIKAQELYKIVLENKLLRKEIEHKGQIITGEQFKNAILKIESELAEKGVFRGDSFLTRVLAQPELIPKFVKGVIQTIKDQFSGVESNDSSGFNLLLKMLFPFFKF